MTTRFVGLMIAILACTFLVAACDSTKPPSPDCIESARLYAEALDQNTRAPADEKAENMATRKASIASLEERKVKACGE
ncbi:MAG: hypothetical protein HOP22_03505 [Nitrospiraceae bacterium]|jgi:hypothetical protein|nr:hypothetical protein [Nitrospiraceae bacterium]